MKNSALPIGVFDSGVGGLTVLRALQERLPQESFLYLGDTARVPYGTKSPETVIRYSIEISQILLNRGIKLLVVACNTATTLALAALKASFTDIPIVGVLEPGAAAACAASSSGHIAVIATEATVNAGGYQKAIKKIRPDAKVTAQGCSLFVSLAEEGWVEGPIVEAVAKRYLQPLLAKSNGSAPDCLVLGCTHFPILLSTIRTVAGQDITVVDSAKTTADVVAKTLKEQGLLVHHSSSHPFKFLATDAPERFARSAAIFLGRSLEKEDIELVKVK